MFVKKNWEPSITWNSTYVSIIRFSRQIGSTLIAHEQRIVDGAPGAPSVFRHTDKLAKRFTILEHWYEFLYSKIWNPTELFEIHPLQFEQLQCERSFEQLWSTAVWWITPPLLNERAICNNKIASDETLMEFCEEVDESSDVCGFVVEHLKAILPIHQDAKYYYVRISPDFSRGSDVLWCTWVSYQMNHFGDDAEAIGQDMYNLNRKIHMWIYRDKVLFAYSD